ncbi:hypothetical protein SEA_MINDY_143 [Mycobacterium phage Mindy]|uniref:Uncharacterized protein n=1 Tax=Mycobacterium phage Mindy TaxID=1647311 RepID=A0A0F6WF40_9CAUD|nr:hypothetical protein SEA_MINDY_143 [Mycobacterium phage Mindy]AVI03377.1 hypothetical protein SEA_ASRIEL_136 [Mycobacterium phage Asriel]AVI03516.1 hypothetical protein SEA_BARBARIAN_139 [Mycobacterium phage Barbarian]QDH92001.1 hypothetical protein SEA_FLYPOTENUSE_134 [Mycobacterium phage Flypotenuse]QGJ91943.1 hypothetical protein SEA_TRAAWW1_136 [Mycobacterium phage Traaww1]AKF15171.1 hypothetical protein SEA_MINDY_143 [Mycobacterium phage Mindy]
MGSQEMLAVGNTVIVAHERWTVAQIHTVGTVHPFQTNTRVVLARAGVNVNVLVAHAMVTRARLLAVLTD